MIAKFDKTTLQSIRRELNAVLAKYGNESGIELSLGNIKFTEAEFEGKLNAKIVGAKTRSDSLLESVVKSQGLCINGIGGKVLVEYKPRNYKYPYVYELNGKRYKCSAVNANIYFKA